MTEEDLKAFITFVNSQAPELQRAVQHLVASSGLTPTKILVPKMSILGLPVEFADVKSVTVVSKAAKGDV